MDWSTQTLTENDPKMELNISRYNGMLKLRNKMKPNFSDEYLENLSKIWLMKVANWIIQFIYLLKGPYNEKRRVLFFDML